MIAETYERIDYSRYVVVPVWYYCNSKCTFCMVERQIAELPTITLDAFKVLCRKVMDAGQHDHLILSGAEITTFDQLDRYIEFAASLGWFKRIQIQTNARRLSNRDLAKRLVDAGLNEAFVSLHGQEEVHDIITEVPGGYKETMRGIENITSMGVHLITNTVLNKKNFSTLLPLIRMLCDMPTSEMHMWNFFPMAGEDRHDLLVDLKQFFALLPDILEIVEASGKPIVFKGFPECLSLGKPGFFDNLFPLNLIDKAFWDNFDENQFGECPYKSQCRAKNCFGLSRAYVKKFGPESELLCPLK
jgi:MoaA/NifB/PqqE/SkfB family radical SAM enzyme